MGVPEGKKKEKGPERILEEIMVKKFPKLIKDNNLHIQEDEQTLRKISTNRFTARHEEYEMLFWNEGWQI